MAKPNYCNTKAPSVFWVLFALLVLGGIGCLIYAMYQNSWAWWSTDTLYMSLYLIAYIGVPLGIVLMVLAMMCRGGSETAEVKPPM